MKEQHLLVDFENVQPGMEDMLKLAPKLTDVWLFHGPIQIKRAEQLKAAHERVTLVPHSGKGKNALDFHLSFYLGYLAAKHPDANLVVVANDKGYDSMLGHAKLLEFRATRLGFKARKAPAAEKAAPAKKATAKKAAPVKKVALPAKKVVAKKAPAKKLPATKAVAKKRRRPIRRLRCRQRPKQRPLQRTRHWRGPRRPWPRWARTARPSSPLCCAT